MKMRKTLVTLFLGLIMIFSLAISSLADPTEKGSLLNNVAIQNGTEREYCADKIDPTPLKKLGTMASAAVNPIDIILQPQDQTGKTGEYFTMSIVAFGSNLTYEWYVIMPNTPDQATAFTEEQSWTLPFAEAYDGFRFYCIVKDDKGNEVKSDTATVTVLSDGIVITKQPKSQTGSNGELAYAAPSRKEQGGGTKKTVRR